MENEETKEWKKNGNEKFFEHAQKMTAASCIGKVLFRATCMSLQSARAPKKIAMDDDDDDVMIISEDKEDDIVLLSIEKTKVYCVYSYLCL